MNCWQCKYYYTNKNEEPCSKCINKNCFLLWFLDEVKTK